MEICHLITLEIPATSNVATRRSPSLDMTGKTADSHTMPRCSLEQLLGLFLEDPMV